MLVLDPGPTTVTWKETGIKLDLIPLLEDADAEFVRQTITTEIDEDSGQKKMTGRDPVKYAQLVGVHCIKGWCGGPVDEKKMQLPCTQKNIERFMLIDAAQAFVFSKVKSLELHVRKEKAAAKKD